MSDRPAEDSSPSPGNEGQGGDDFDLVDLLLPLLLHWKLLLLGPLLAGALALAVSYLIPETYTSRTIFLPPQPQQSAAASALASLGALSGLAGMSGGARTPGDQYVSLMQSVSVTDRLIDSFDLMKVYDVKHRFEARKELAKNVRISLGKKDGLITVEVDDHEPRRAADLANRHVEELRRITGELALTEAQQRRAFFETQLKQTRDRLATAQRALLASGFDSGALRAEPKAAAEEYARLSAELTTAKVRLDTLRSGLAENSPEVQLQQALVNALQLQLTKLEATSGPSRDRGEYVGRYREFKYQETLFELFSRQYELARVDESREGGFIQVVDVATPPEWKSRPKRLALAIAASFVAGLVALAFVTARHALRRAARHPEGSLRLMRLREAWQGKDFGAH